MNSSPRHTPSDPRRSPSTLPDAARMPKPSPAPVPVSAPLPGPACPLASRVLVVDDSRAEQRLIAALLSQIGMTVEAVDSGESALAWLAHQTPDLMVIDVVMPGMSGFDLCRQLRARPETAQVPVIFCTSKDQEFDRFWGLRQGGSVYLTKPFAPQDLIAAVTSCLA